MAEIKFMMNIREIVDNVRSFQRTTFVREGSLEIISREFKNEQEKMKAEILEPGDDLDILTKIGFESKKSN